MSKRFWLLTFMALVAAAPLAASFSPAYAQGSNPGDYAYPDYQGNAYCYPGQGNMGALCPMGPGYASSANPAVSGPNHDSYKNKRAGYTGPQGSLRQGNGRWMGCGYGW